MPFVLACMPCHVKPHTSGSFGPTHHPSPGVLSSICSCGDNLWYGDINQTLPYASESVASTVILAAQLDCTVHMCACQAMMTGMHSGQTWPGSGPVKQSGPEITSLFTSTQSICLLMCSETVQPLRPRPSHLTPARRRVPQ